MLPLYLLLHYRKGNIRYLALLKLLPPLILLFHLLVRSLIPLPSMVGIQPLQVVPRLQLEVRILLRIFKLVLLIQIPANNGLIPQLVRLHFIRNGLIMPSLSQPSPELVLLVAGVHHLLLLPLPMPLVLQ